MGREMLVFEGIEQPAVIDTVQDLNDCLLADVRRWFQREYKPMPMVILCRRYNRVAGRFGERVNLLLFRHADLIIRENRRGGKLIVPKLEYEEMANEYGGIGLMKYWESQNVPF